MLMTKEVFFLDNNDKGKFVYGTQHASPSCSFRGSSGKNRRHLRHKAQVAHSGPLKRVLVSCCCFGARTLVSRATFRAQVEARHERFDSPAVLLNEDKRADGNVSTVKESDRTKILAALPIWPVCVVCFRLKAHNSLL